jgi:hypothetical protein
MNTITNLHICAAEITEHDVAYIGLLAGFIANAAVSFCSAAGKITTPDSDGVGGMTGWSGASTFVSCSSSVNIVANDGVRIGGFCGFADGTTSAFTDCYAIGDITIIDGIEVD